MAPQFILPLVDELLVDLFAGGGGASTGIEQAIGRHVDVSINHDPDAVALHAMNHPQTRHYTADVFEVDPRQATAGRPVGLLHASPDCTHHSQARGGQPRSRAVRSLSWVVHRWAGQARPRVITLENVEQILQWSPLVAKRCPRTGRVLRLDGTVAAPGERVPVQEQFLVPDVRRKGRNWQHFVAGLRAMGYVVQWRTLCAADFGAPTTRTRLFMVARCDGEPITWPQPSHHKRPARGQKPWRAASECIDWHLPCPSIFRRPRPLAEATLRRVAKGIKRYVLDSADPFIVRIGQMGSAGDHVRGVDQPVSTVTTKAEHALVAPTLVQAGYGERTGQAPRVLDLAQPLGTVVAGGGKHALAGATLLPLTHQGSNRINSPADPLPTITTAHRGEMAMATAVLVGVGGRAGQTEPRPVHEPGLTTTGKADCAVSVAYLAQMNGGGYTGSGHDAREPASTITAAGSQQQLVAALLTHAYGSNTCGGQGDMRQPAKTITTGGHHALLECTLSQEHEEAALHVAAFLTRYYGTGGQHGDLRDPLATITTRDRLALVTVTVRGTPYVIVDIGLRMLQPAELYRCQGFPGSYIIDRRADGTTLTKSAQTRMCGNSVSPPPMAALVRANYADAAMRAAA